MDHSLMVNLQYLRFNLAGENFTGTQFFNQASWDLTVAGFLSGGHLGLCPDIRNLRYFREGS